MAESNIEFVRDFCRKMINRLSITPKDIAGNYTLGCIDSYECVVNLINMIIGEEEDK